MANGERTRTETVRAESAAAWVGDELRRAFETIGVLQREVEQLRTALTQQVEHVASLRETVQTVDGRTQRHESGQDAARELQYGITHLEEQLEAEASLRRDLADHVQRSQGRENELEMELRRTLEVISRRLAAFEEAQAAASEQQRRIAAGLAQQSQLDSNIEGRLDGVEQHLSARQDRGDHSGETIVRLEADVLSLRSTFDALDQRLAAMQIDQRRLDEALAQVRSIRDRETELLDLLEQQRASRAHVETRLGEIEESLSSHEQRASNATDERMLLQREQSGNDERLRALGERVEAQRLAFVEHLRRELRAGEESGKRQVEEIERELRVARGLLLRLTEESAEASSLEEQPL